MSALWIESAAGLLAGGLLGWCGYLLGALTSGAAATLALLGLLNFGLGGWSWGAAALLGMGSSLAWWRYRAVRQASPRPTRKGWAELAARLGWATALAALGRVTGRPADVLPAYIGALAATTADAWATDVGVLSPVRPRLLIFRRRVAAGTPGAISLLGGVAALGGAWFVGLAGLVFALVHSVFGNAGPWRRSLLWLPLCAALGGVAGCLLDSFLGATAQAYYHCERCNAYSETPVHNCGQAASPVRGWSWLTNEGVDWVSSIFGAALTAALLAGLARCSLTW